MSDAWLTASASNLGRGIAKGDIDPIDLTECYLDAASTHEFSNRIFTHVTRERAIAEAKAAQTRAKNNLRHGLLDGVPTSWKDLVDTAGIETKAGSDLLSGRIPEHDGQCLQQATQAGLVCMGKTHMSELAFSGLGYNPITQTPPCVNDYAAVPGGSSSGAAASVAFGLSAIGIGSDTGGSVRIPSAWNDLVGLKTTSGLISLQGVLPLVETFDTIGPLCRSVEDAAHALSALTGTSAPDLSNATLAGTHFAVCNTSALDDLDDSVAKTFETCLSRLSAAGAKITVVDLPLVQDLLDLAGVLFTSEAYATWRTEIEANPTAMYPEILERFRSGANVNAADYITAHKRMIQLRQEYCLQTAGFDAMLLPTSPILPPNLHRLNTDHNYYVTRNLLALRNTRIGNLLGLCGLTLPTGTSSVGVMALSHPFQENKLLRFGSALEPLFASS